MNTANRKHLVPKLLLLLLIAMVVAVLGYKLFIRFPGGAGLLEDDSYFYSQIAYNLGTVHKSSFDGINITDGYHLLWGWLLGLISYIISFFTLNKDIHLIAMLTVYFWISFTTAFLFGRNNIAKAAMIFFTLLYAGLMETPLLALLLLLFIHFRFLNDDDKKTWLIYPVLVLIPLTRIDSVVIVFVLSLFYLKNKKIKLFFETNILTGIGSAIQLLAMKTLFGSFTTVSSMIKASTLTNFKFNLANNFNKYTVILIALYLITFLSIYISRILEIKEKLYFILAASAAYMPQIFTNSRLLRFISSETMKTDNLIERYKFSRPGDIPGLSSVCTIKQMENNRSESMSSEYPALLERQARKVL